jgi:RNA polymerase sigma-70 factor (ECF subfamily)
LNQEQAIALYQPLLHRIAYNLLRCRADAEDIVQDTFIKWLTIDQTKIENTKAYLIKSVTNNCLNHLNALKRKKEEYFDSIQLPDFLTKLRESELMNIDLEKELSAAFRVIQNKLEPLERAAYLLKDVFDFDYDEIQKILDKKADHCRQLLSRARKKIEDEKGKINIGLPNSTQLFENFKNACNLNDATDFINSLKNDISRALNKKK